MRRWLASAVVGLLAGPAVAQSPPESCWIRDIAVPSGDEVWLLCEEGAVGRTSDGGRTWSQANLGLRGGWHAIEILGSGQAIAVGSGGRMARTADGGSTWERLDPASGLDLYAVAAAEGHVWTAGEAGLMLHSPDGGATWEIQPTFTTVRIEGLFFLDARRGWAAGWAGTLLRTTDGGRFWEQINPEGVYGSFSGVWFADERNGWAIGSPGVLLRTADGGETWTHAVEQAPAGMLRSIDFDAAGAGVIAGDRLLLHRRDGWEPVSWAPPETFVAAKIADGAIWAAGPHFLARSDDAGRSWRLVWSETGLRELPGISSWMPANPLERHPGRRAGAVHCRASPSPRES